MHLPRSWYIIRFLHFYHSFYTFFYFWYLLYSPRNLRIREIYQKVGQKNHTPLKNNFPLIRFPRMICCNYRMVLSMWISNGSIITLHYYRMGMWLIDNYNFLSDEALKVTVRTLAWNNWNDSFIHQSEVLPPYLFLPPNSNMSITAI